MPYSHISDYPADILARAAKIRLACFDVDGTLTDGRLLFDDDGRELKAFHVRDGQGLTLLRRVGIAVAFVTARPGAIAERRAAELGADAYAKVGDKLGCVRDIAARTGHRNGCGCFHGRRLLATWSSCGPRSLRRTGRRAPLGPRTRALANDCRRRRRARELCDLLLAAQGHADAMLQLAEGVLTNAGPRR